MIRRHPPRHRGQHRDFHFFAAGDPTANLESQSRRAAQSAPPQPAIRSESPSRESIASEGPDSSGASTETASLTPAAQSAIQQSIDFLAKIDDPRELIGRPRPAFMGELDALAASRPKASANGGKQPASLHARKRKPAPEPAPEPMPGATHHERHCKVCSHPDRADIEADFVEWAQPDAIAREYSISRSSIYRHARAVGLFDRRNRNLRFALGRLIEWVDSVQPTADSIVRAVHAFARINDQGEWVEPPAHVIVSSGGVRREAAAPAARRPIAISLDSPALGNVIDVPAEAALPAPASAPPSEAALPAITTPMFAPSSQPGPGGALPETANRVETDATR